MGLDLYNQNLSYSKSGKQITLTHDNITFFKVLSALKDFQDSIQWIPSDDHKKIVSDFKSFCHQEIEELFKIRHAFSHRARPAIDTTGTGPIILGGKHTGENGFTIDLLEDKSYSSAEIESQYLRAWDIMRESTLGITGLDCFK